MKKLIGLILIIVAASLLLTGCPKPSAPVIETPEPPADLYDKVWISPGKINVGHFYPGARAEYPLSIHNGNDQQTEFSITFKEPGNTSEGYVAAPEEAQDWVIIADPSPVIAAKETKEVLIALEMPKGAEAPAKWWEFWKASCACTQPSPPVEVPEKWEFWVVVKDSSQTGMVQTELACRWLVTMK